MNETTKEAPTLQVLDSGSGRYSSSFMQMDDGVVRFGQVVPNSPVQAAMDNLNRLTPGQPPQAGQCWPSYPYAHDPNSRTVGGYEHYRHYPGFAGQFPEPADQFSGNHAAGFPMRYQEVPTKTDGLMGNHLLCLDDGLGYPMPETRAASLPPFSSITTQSLPPRPQSAVKEDLRGFEEGLGARLTGGNNTPSHSEFGEGLTARLLERGMSLPSREENYTPPVQYRPWEANPGPVRVSSRSQSETSQTPPSGGGGGYPSDKRDEDGSGGGSESRSPWYRAKSSDSGSYSKEPNLISLDKPNDLNSGAQKGGGNGNGNGSTGSNSNALPPTSTVDGPTDSPGATYSTLTKVPPQYSHGPREDPADISRLPYPSNSFGYFPPGLPPPPIGAAPWDYRGELNPLKPLNPGEAGGGVAMDPKYPVVPPPVVRPGDMQSGMPHQYLDERQMVRGAGSRQHPQHHGSAYCQNGNDNFKSFATLNDAQSPGSVAGLASQHHNTPPNAHHNFSGHHHHHPQHHHPHHHPHHQSLKSELEPGLKAGDKHGMKDGGGTGRGTKHSASSGGGGGADGDPSNEKKPKKQKRKRCGECLGCQRKDNCGECAPCRNDKSHQICKMRRCEKLIERKNCDEKLVKCAPDLQHQTPSCAVAMNPEDPENGGDEAGGTGALSSSSSDFSGFLVKDESTILANGIYDAVTQDMDPLVGLSAPVATPQHVSSDRNVPYHKVQDQGRSYTELGPPTMAVDRHKLTNDKLKEKLHNKQKAKLALEQQNRATTTASPGLLQREPKGPEACSNNWNVLYEVMNPQQTSEGFGSTNDGLKSEKGLYPPAETGNFCNYQTPARNYNDVTVAGNMTTVMNGFSPLEFEESSLIQNAPQMSPHHQVQQMSPRPAQLEQMRRLVEQPFDMNLTQQTPFVRGSPAQQQFNTPPQELQRETPSISSPQHPNQHQSQHSINQSHHPSQYPTHNPPQHPPQYSPQHAPQHSPQQPPQHSPQHPLQNQSQHPPQHQSQNPPLQPSQNPPQQPSQQPPQQPSQQPPQQPSQLPPQQPSQHPFQHQSQLPFQHQPQLPLQHQSQLSPQQQSQHPPQHQAQHLLQHPPQHQSQHPPQHQSQLPTQHQSQLPTHQSQHPPQHQSQHPPQHQSQHPPQHQSQLPIQHQSQHPIQHQSQHPPQHQSHHPPQHQSQHPPQHQSQHPPQHQSHHPPQHQSHHPPQHQSQHPPQHQSQHPPQHQSQHPPQHQPYHPLQMVHAPAGGGGGIPAHQYPQQRFSYPNVERSRDPSPQRNQHDFNSMPPPPVPSPQRSGNQGYLSGQMPNMQNARESLSPATSPVLQRRLELNISASPPATNIQSSSSPLTSPGRNTPYGSPMSPDVRRRAYGSPSPQQQQQRGLSIMSSSSLQMLTNQAFQRQSPVPYPASMRNDNEINPLPSVSPLMVHPASPAPLSPMCSPQMTRASPSSISSSANHLTQQAMLPSHPVPPPQTHMQQMVAQDGGRTVGHQPGSFSNQNGSMLPPSPIQHPRHQTPSPTSNIFHSTGNHQSSISRNSQPGCWNSQARVRSTKMQGPRLDQRSPSAPPLQQIQSMSVLPSFEKLKCDEAKLFRKQASYGSIAGNCVPKNLLSDNLAIPSLLAKTASAATAILKRPRSASSAQIPAASILQDVLPPTCQSAAAVPNLAKTLYGKPILRHMLANAIRTPPPITVSALLDSKLDTQQTNVQLLEQLERLRNNVKLEAPPCNCLPKEGLPERTPFYTHLGSGPTLPALREVMEERFGVKGEAIRIEKVLYTGREGKTTQGCPIAKWIIRRAGPEEKFLALVKHRIGHYCPTAWIVIVIVAWEGVPSDTADDLYNTLVYKLPKFGLPTQRRCGINEQRTCACQGMDEKSGASFSFGCSWSMYYNGCKFARSKNPRKFRLSEPTEEDDVEEKLQNLATNLSPFYKQVAPDSYGNQVAFETYGSECRIGRKPGRPWSGVTACVDFCAHSHKDLHNMNNGCTVVVTLTKHRGFQKPEDEQLHVLPLYVMDGTDEFGSKEGQERKMDKGSLEMLRSYPMELRFRNNPLTPCRRRGKKRKDDGSLTPKEKEAVAAGMFEGNITGSPSPRGSGAAVNLESLLTSPNAGGGGAKPNKHNWAHFKRPLFTHPQMGDAKLEKLSKQLAAYRLHQQDGMRRQHQQEEIRRHQQEEMRQQHAAFEQRKQQMTMKEQISIRTDMMLNGNAGLLRNNNGNDPPIVPPELVSLKREIEPPIKNGDSNRLVQNLENGMYLSSLQLLSSAAVKREPVDIRDPAIGEPLPVPLINKPETQPSVHSLTSPSPAPAPSPVSRPGTPSCNNPSMIPSCGIPMVNPHGNRSLPTPPRPASQPNFNNCSSPLPRPASAWTPSNHMAVPPDATYAPPMGTGPNRTSTVQTPSQGIPLNDPTSPEGMSVPPMTVGPNRPSMVHTPSRGIPLNDTTPPDGLSVPPMTVGPNRPSMVHTPSRGFPLNDSTPPEGIFVPPMTVGPNRPSLVRTPSGGFPLNDPTLASPPPAHTPLFPPSTRIPFHPSMKISGGHSSNFGQPPLGDLYRMSVNPQGDGTAHFRQNSFAHFCHQAPPSAHTNNNNNNCHVVRLKAEDGGKYIPDPIETHHQVHGNPQRFQFPKPGNGEMAPNGNNLRHPVPLPFPEAIPHVQSKVNGIKTSPIRKPSGNLILEYLPLLRAKMFPNWSNDPNIRCIKEEPPDLIEPEFSSPPPSPAPYGERDPNGFYEIHSENEENFQDLEIGGVAIALGHGSVLFECAKHELHATTALKNPNRNEPTRISLVFYQHKNLNLRHHGSMEYERKMEQKRMDDGTDGVLNKKRKKNGDEPVVNTAVGVPVELPVPVRQSGNTIPTTSWVTVVPDTPLIVTGPYQKWI